MWYSKNQKYGQGQCIPTWERMIIVGMDPSLRTIWRATCVYVDPVNTRGFLEAACSTVYLSAGRPAYEGFVGLATKDDSQTIRRTCDADNECIRCTLPVFSVPRCPQ